MGVYIFRSKHADVIKIGHYNKQNAWSRIAHRGFSSCICPKSIEGRVSVDDVDLLYWFPDLTTKDEKSWHRLCAAHASAGEWFNVGALDLLPLSTLENKVDQCDRVAALATRRRL